MVLAGAVGPVLVLTLEEEPLSPWILLAPGSVFLVWLLLFRMVTEVDSERLRVSFGWIPTYRCAFRLADILQTEKVKYQPIREFGGWGIRGIPVQCLSAQGDEGVRLTLKGGRKMLIGSQQATKLQTVLSKRV